MKNLIEEDKLIENNLKNFDLKKSDSDFFLRCGLDGLFQESYLGYFGKKFKIDFDYKSKWVYVKNIGSIEVVEDGRYYWFKINKLYFIFNEKRNDILRPHKSLFFLKKLVDINKKDIEIKDVLHLDLSDVQQFIKSCNYTAKQLSFLNLNSWRELSNNQLTIKL